MDGCRGAIYAVLMEAICTFGWNGCGSVGGFPSWICLKGKPLAGFWNGKEDQRRALLVNSLRVLLVHLLLPVSQPAGLTAWQPGSLAAGWFNRRQRVQPAPPFSCWCDRSGMAQGVGNEPDGDSLKGDHT